MPALTMPALNTDPNGLTDIELRVRIGLLTKHSREKEDWVLSAILESALQKLDARIEQTAMTRTLGIRDAAASALIKKRIRIGGRDVSVRLEKIFWDGLDVISKSLDQEIPAICETIRNQPDTINLASSIRIYVVRRLGVTHSPIDWAAAAE